jgi:hypothetical protein
MSLIILEFLLMYISNPRNRILFGLVIKVFSGLKVSFKLESKSSFARLINIAKAIFRGSGKLDF